MTLVTRLYGLVAVVLETAANVRFYKVGWSNIPTQ